jgi:DeoR/GlpR family transcriptional regulator of sugar metabolism
LAPHTHVTVIMLGGVLRHSELSMLGVLAEDALKNLRADKLFMGTPAIHVDHGLSADDMTEVQSDRAIMASAREITVLADHTKFGRIATVRQAPIERIRRLVTDPVYQKRALRSCTSAASRSRWSRFFEDRTRKPRRRRHRETVVARIVRRS